MNKIKNVFFDFDGVVTRNTPEMFVQLTYEIINAHTFLAKETIQSYFESVISFSPLKAIDFFLGEVGLKHLIPEIMEAYKSSITNNANFESMIDKDFFTLVEKLNLNGINWRIVSLGATDHLVKGNLIKAENIYNLNGQSKGNPETYKNIIESLSVRAEECLIIDDGILSLRAAKINSINTVFMQNNFYGKEELYQLYQSFVDYRVFNLKDLSKYVF